MANPNDLNYSDLTDTPPNPLPSPPANPGRPSQDIDLSEVERRSAERGNLLRAPLLDQLPGNEDGEWSIDYYYHPILHRGHAYPVLIDPQGRVREELHGLAYDRNTGDITSVGRDGNALVGLRWQNPNYETDTKDHQSHHLGEGQQLIGNAVAGSYSDIVQGLWRRAMAAADQINTKNFDYKGHDPAYELGSERGGQVQNSNSVANTLGLAMGVEPHCTLKGLACNQGWQRKFPGMDNNLLDPSYRRYRYPITAVEDPSLRQGSSP